MRHARRHLEIEGVPPVPCHDAAEHFNRALVVFGVTMMRKWMAQGIIVNANGELRINRESQWQ
jgi:hypothetical protein